MNLGERLRQACADGHVWAVIDVHCDPQYPVYYVALKRHLLHPLPGDDPDTHLGIQRHLLQHGRCGGQAPDRVFRGRPPTTLITALHAAAAGKPLEAMA